MGLLAEGVEVAGDRPLVVVTRNDAYPVAAEVIERILWPVADVEYISTPFWFQSCRDEVALEEALREASGLLLRPGQATRGMLRSCPKLRIIGVHGVGLEQVDLDAATEYGVVVTNAPGGNSRGVAELTIALALCVLRGVCKSHSMVVQGKWDTARVHGGELRGRTWSVIGLGNIGRQVACLAVAFGARVLGYDPHVVPVSRATPLELKGFEEALRYADVVSLHVPLTTQTCGLIDRKAIGLMRSGAILINTSRGQVVDQAALEDALRSGRLAGAGLDVLAEEPPDRDRGILRLENVVITPHMGGSTWESLARIAEIVATDIRGVLLGAQPEYPVNLPAAR